ncbi:hypothetical protein ACIP8Z_16020 [Streptomyces sp. NPDC088553]|uniref:hypothetical protein n=1 Tax=Streptomyces sp. NPDC088553 TaxID=3365864 RepID=UPI0038084D50
MEESSGEAESYGFDHCSTPSSGRELSSVQLDWSSATTDTERKQVIADAGTTLEELREIHGLDVERYGTAVGDR